MRNVGIELKTLNNALLRRLSRYAGAPGGDITGTNGWIIEFLADNSERDVYQQEIEAEFSITRSTASRVVGLMERKGLIEKCADETDARKRIIRLTDRARESAKNLSAVSEQVGLMLTRGFSEDEMDLLINFMERMKQNIASEDE